jgi:hypothetical protein
VEGGEGIKRDERKGGSKTRNRKIERQTRMKSCDKRRE